MFDRTALRGLSIILGLLIAAAGCTSGPGEQQVRVAESEAERALTEETVEGSEQVRITIADEHEAAWIPINNTFTYTPGEWPVARKFWNGVLIQPGEFKNFASSADMDTFKYVNIRNGDGSIVASFDKSDFTEHTTWINVVARHPGDDRDEPMQYDDLKRLYVDRKNDTNKNVRPIRHFFKPYRGAITVWHSHSGYLLNAEPGGTDNLHNSYEFVLPMKDKVTVQVYQDGKKLHEWGDVKSITISAADIPEHGGNKNPPQPPPG